MTLQEGASADLAPLVLAKPTFETVTLVTEKAADLARV